MGKTMLIPLCFRKHWILGRMSLGKAGIALEIFDSAPEQGTKECIERFFTGQLFQHFGNIKISYPPCPRQPPNSSQCGLHLIVNAAAMAKGKKPPISTACYEVLIPLEDKGFITRLEGLVS
eukprot:Tbor_TRINITY_DN5998_c2_g1::TRINITY_DN5998_c2_g1_i2::g.18168::m.18168